MMNETQSSEHRNGNGSGRSVFAGVLIGGLTGAIAGLLLAPQSGKRTRDQIQNKAADLRGRAGEKVEDTLGQIRERAQLLKAGLQNRAEELKHQGQDVLVGQLDRVAAAAEARKKEIQAGRS